MNLRPLLRRVLLVGIALLATATTSVTSAQPIAQKLPPWSELDFKATKLMLSAYASVKAGAQRTQRVPWVEVGEGEVLTPPAKELAVVEVTSSLLGRRSLTRLWFDPSDLTAYQKIIRDSGSRKRHKNVRFCKAGTWVSRAAPRDDERELEPQHWTERSGIFDHHGEVEALSEPATLLFLLSAKTPPRSKRYHVHSQNLVVEIEVEYAGRKTLSVAYDTVLADGSEGDEIRGSRELAHYVVRPLPDPARGVEAEDFRLLGLSGDIDVYVDPELRAPVRIVGSISPLGRVATKLRTLRLR